jgi:hypothetical protein
LSSSYTGFLPQLSNVTQLDGSCVPDWVFPTKNEVLKKKNETLSNSPKCQMYITLEMKNYAEKIGANVVKSVLRRAAEKGRNIAKLWPKGTIGPLLPIYHVHLFCVSSVAEIRNWGAIQSKCSHVLKLYQLCYNSSTNKLGLTDKFVMMDTDTTEDDDDINDELHADPVSESDFLAQDMEIDSCDLDTLNAIISSLNPSNFPQPQPDAQESEMSKKLSDLERIKMVPDVTYHFPHTTVIIIALEDLFRYGLESAGNLSIKLDNADQRKASILDDELAAATEGLSL